MIVGAEQLIRIDAEHTLVPVMSCDDKKYVEGHMSNLSDFIGACGSPSLSIDEAWLQAVLADKRHMVNSGAMLDYALQEEERVIGAMGVSLYKPEAEGYYWLGQSYQGNGIATRGMRAIIDHVFASRRVPFVNFVIHPDNAPSQRLAERLGAIKTTSRPLLASLLDYDIWRVQRG